MSSKEYNANIYIKNADSACKSCESFGTSSCPSFQKAVNEHNIDPDILTQKITIEQENTELSPCDNVNDLEA